MKHKKTIIIPVHAQTIIEFETCDLCGERKIDDCYEINEIEIRHKQGENYPECGSGTETTFDVCGNCFDQKLVPWLISQGAKPQIEKWEW
jgi:hypothetical protein